MTNAQKTHGLTGNQNAAKPEAEKKTGKGRLVVDLGEIKTRLVQASAGGKLKPLVCEILDEGLSKRGF